MASIEEEVGALLAERRLTIATAESTTGGYIGHLLNNVPGSSRYYIGSVVAYSNSPKIQVLNVPEDTLKGNGSVSAQTTLAMAEGVLELMGVDIGISESGVAGPGGGTGQHPVGTVFIAITARDGYQLAERNVWQGDRISFKQQTAQAALEMVRHYLNRDTGQPQPKG